MAGVLRKAAARPRARLSETLKGACHPPHPPRGPQLPPRRLRCWPGAPLPAASRPRALSPAHLVPPTFSCTISPLPAAAAAKLPQCLQPCPAAPAALAALLPGRGRRARGGSPRRRRRRRRGLQGQQGGGGRAGGARSLPHLLAGRAGSSASASSPRLPQSWRAAGPPPLGGLQAAGPGGLPGQRAAGPAATAAATASARGVDRCAGQIRRRRALRPPRPAKLKEARSGGVELPTLRPARREGGGKRLRAQRRPRDPVSSLLPVTIASAFRFQIFRDFSH